MLYLFAGAALAFSPSTRVRLEPEVALHNPATSSWTKVGKPEEPTIKLTAVLKAPGRAALEQKFWEVSDPKHADYGKYLSHAEIAKLLAVGDATVGKVVSSFEEAGATVTVAPSRDALTLNMAVAAAERLLDTQLFTFAHRDRPDVRVMRAAAPISLPAELAEDVAFIGELLQFPALRRTDLTSFAPHSPATWPNECAASGCAGLVQPSVLNERYKLGGERAAKPRAGDTTNTMAVAEFQGQFFKESDIEAFSESCKVPVEVDHVIGTNKSKSGIEAELDIEYIRSVAQDVPLTVVYDAAYSLLSWANQITSLDASPLVHSVSYGNDEKQQTSTAYMESCNTMFMKAGVAGLSVLFASGDQGVCGREGCGGIFRKKGFNPDFPAASPYITAVGGTDFVEKGVIGDEKAWTDGGGGFSDTFAIPSYQSGAVAKYKSTATLPPQAYWNNTGRGYPDVAALGGQVNPYCVCVTQGISQRFAGVAGTSAACPVVAGVFAKLNGLRLAAGKPSMGFLNPFIYANADAFNDVTSGENKANFQYGFKATAGWDPATGMGTPNYEALAKLV
jgi:tripeptidyl-peptidase-1